MNEKFAIFCRVSTEGQAQDGESLAVQTSTLQNCVNMLKGTIVKSYIATESATAGDKERPKLDEMINDARNKVFTSLMVYDLSRLTRDPTRNKYILAELKKHNIKLYVQMQLYSLDSPETNFLIGILAEVNAFQASIQIHKSIESKIALAKKGWQMVGKAPWGRMLEHNDHSKSPVWILDNEKVAVAQRIYDLYINQGIYIDKIAKMMDMDASTVFRIVKDKAVLYQSIMYKGEKVEIKTPVPPLFTKDQQEQLKTRLRNNRKNNSKKNDYLLGGFVRCNLCHYTYIGITTNKGKNSYYRHSVHSITDTCIKNIPKDSLDKAVLDNISELVSNNELLMNTIRDCNNQSVERKKQLQDSLALLLDRQKKIEQRKARAINLVLDGKLSEDDVKSQVDNMKEELSKLSTEILSKQTEIESMENSEVPDEVLERIRYTFDCLQGRYGNNINQWAFEIKRLLVEWFFGLSNDNGVWVSGTGKNIDYTIKSNLGTIGFGWLNDEDGAAGVVGQDNMKAKTPATLAQFSGILKNLDGLCTRNHIDQYEGCFVYINHRRWRLLLIRAGGKLVM